MCQSQNRRRPGGDECAVRQCLWACVHPAPAYAQIRAALLLTMTATRELCAGLGGTGLAGGGARGSVAGNGDRQAAAGQTGAAKPGGRAGAAGGVAPRRREGRLTAEQSRATGQAPGKRPSCTSFFLAPWLTRIATPTWTPARTKPVWYWLRGVGCPVSRDKGCHLDGFVD